MYTLKFRKTEKAPELGVTITKSQLDAYIKKYAHYYYVKVYDEEGRYLIDESHLSYTAMIHIAKSRPTIETPQDALRNLSNIMNSILKVGTNLGVDLSKEEKSLLDLLGGSKDDKEE